jgi:hypothetical protein
MNKQSSVDWLVNQYSKYCDDSQVPFEVFEQAKAMHKEEIKKAWLNGYTAIDAKNAETYYNEMYGGNNEQ